jgi:hypothetical protein
MKLTFDQAAEHAATEFYTLRQRATHPEAFDCAVESMRAERHVADTATGTVRNRDGFVSAFTGYDWAAQYDDTPNHVFYDFFRGALMNKYSRILRGLNP